MFSFYKGADKLISYVKSSHRIYLQSTEEEKEQREVEEIKRKQEKEEHAKLKKEKPAAAKEKESLYEKMKKAG